MAKKISAIDIAKLEDPSKKIDVVLILLTWSQLTHEPTVQDIKKVNDHLSNRNVPIPIVVVVSKFDTVKGLGKEFHNNGFRLLQCNKWEQIRNLLKEKAGIKNMHLRACVCYCQEYQFSPKNANASIEYMVLSIFHEAVTMAMKNFLPGSQIHPVSPVLPILPEPDVPDITVTYSVFKRGERTTVVKGSITILGFLKEIMNGREAGYKVAIIDGAVLKYLDDTTLLSSLPTPRLEIIPPSIEVTLYKGDNIKNIHVSQSDSFLQLLKMVSPEKWSGLELTIRNSKPTRVCPANGNVFAMIYSNASADFEIGESWF